MFSRAGRKDSRIEIRCARGEKARLEAEARKAKLSLAEYVFQRIGVRKGGFVALGRRVGGGKAPKTRA